MSAASVTDNAIDPRQGSGMTPYYAHTLEGRPPAEWESLEKHLEEVAKLSGTFAEAFGAGEWGRLAGLWHDLGKYSREFQDSTVHNATSRP